MIRLTALLVCLLAASAGRAHALTLLALGKQASFLDLPGTERDSARIEVRGDPALRLLADPRDCATDAALELASYPVARNLVVKNLSLALPCTGWHADGDGVHFVDRAAGADVRLSRDRLVVRVTGGSYAAVAGPVGYAELWLTLAGERVLVRFHDFARNDARAIVARPPSPTAGAGEAAFWRTLWSGDRPNEAVDLLGRAAARDRRDGRSRFLLAMLHLYRFGQATTDLHRASDFAIGEIEAANRDFAIAVPLLWDAARGDSRVPGFAAAATYLHGATAGDALLSARGLDQLEAAYAANPLFNSFDLIGVVPAAVSPDDPLYGRVLEVLDAALSGGIGACAGGQDEICGNRGMAPHNAEGAFLLFGDIYAKGGRTDDARRWYEAAVSLGATSGWSARFLELARARAAQVAERVALYSDADPANDPPIIGSGPGACAYCHNQ